MQTDLPKIEIKCPEEHPCPLDRMMSVNWAKDLLQKTDWVIMDTETTGLGETAEIIQLAILSPNNEVLLETFIRPIRCKQISPEATAVHHITMDMLQDAPTFAELMPKLQEVLKGKTVVFYNAEFDSRMLKRAAAMSGDGNGKLDLNTQCAMLAYSAFVGEKLNGKQDYKWQRLTGGDHSAAGDCRATLALIHKMASFLEHSLT